MMSKEPSCVVEVAVTDQWQLMHPLIGFYASMGV